MTLLVSEYVRRSGIQDDLVRFEWDEWNEEATFEPLDDRLLKRLAAVSFRANESLTMASMEWIVYRLGSVSTDPTPLNYTEAAWAGMVNWRYTKYYEPRPNADSNSY